MQVVSVVRSQGFRTVVKHPSLEQINTIVKKIVQRLVQWYVEVAVSKLDVKFMFEVFVSFWRIQTSEINQML